jgi:hypothetical protein
MMSTMWPLCEERGRETRDTQLDTIREIMLAAGARGAWLTLEEIAELTEIGEASISAQLRHLRKLQHGRHRVEKRRRTLEQQAEEDTRERDIDRERHIGNVGEPVRWEYRVLPPSVR